MVTLEQLLARLQPMLLYGAFEHYLITVNDVRVSRLHALVVYLKRCHPPGVDNKGYMVESKWCLFCWQSWFASSSLQCSKVSHFLWWSGLRSHLRRFLVRKSSSRCIVYMIKALYWRREGIDIVDFEYSIVIAFILRNVGEGPHNPWPICVIFCWSMDPWAMPWWLHGDKWSSASLWRSLFHLKTFIAAVALVGPFIVCSLLKDQYFPLSDEICWQYVLCQTVQCASSYWEAKCLKNNPYRL